MPILNMSDTISDIVLIGPARAGKSTIGKLLAEALELPQISLDSMRWVYYKEMGYDENFAQEIRTRCGFLALVLYWNLFAAYAVERLLSDYQTCVVDFGAGIYESQESFARVQQTLSRYRNVVLLLPSPNQEESLRILKERDANPPHDLNFDLNAHFLTHHSYYDLAKLTVYTHGKTPAQTCAEILELTGLPAKAKS
jgi:adenylate kinase family enzyme